MKTKPYEPTDAEILAFINKPTIKHLGDGQRLLRKAVREILINKNKENERV